MSNEKGLAGLSDIVRLGDEEATVAVLSQAVLGLWEVVNNLTRLQPTRRLRYRVSIFGSARTDPDHWVYAAVRDLAEELTRRGCDIVTGGGPGLMQAAYEGARLAGGDPNMSSVGIRVDLPFEQEVNPFVGQVFEHRTFFSRLHHFVLISDAFVVVPGGIGTVLETMMIWQLLQVQKLRDTPLIMVGAMWAELVEWAKESMLRPESPLAPRILPFRSAARPAPKFSKSFVNTTAVESESGGDIVTRRPTAPAVSPQASCDMYNGLSALIARYGCGPVGFTGSDDALYERRLVFDHVVAPEDAGPREQFEAVGAAIRDVLSQRWVRTQQEYDRANPKQVYYLSMEFLIGRSLANNITNLMLSPVVDAAAREKGLKLAEIFEQEPDAGLGNGGLGRLAVCFIDSLSHRRVRYRPSLAL